MTNDYIVLLLAAPRPSPRFSLALALSQIASMVESILPPISGMPVQCGKQCQAFEVPPSTSSSRIDAAPAKYKSTTDDGSGPPNASFVVAVRDDVEAVLINGTLDDEDRIMIAESWRIHGNLLMIFVRRDDCFYTPFPLSQETNSPRSLKDVFGRVPCLQRSSPRIFCNLAGPFTHSR